jgi:FkbM family methyltransferase
MIYPKYDTHFTAWKDGTYQRNLYDMAMKHVKQKRLALDVGAHVGTFSLYMADDFKFVFAFEPVLDCIECFKQNVTVDNVYLMPLALLNRTCIINMTMENGNNSGTWELTKNETAIRGISIPLDALTLNEIDLIKIDIQKAELEALVGMQTTLLRCKPVLLVEITTKGPHEFLTSLGAKQCESEGRDDYVYKWE